MTSELWSYARNLHALTLQQLALSHSKNRTQTTGSLERENDSDSKKKKMLYIAYLEYLDCKNIGLRQKKSEIIQNHKN